MKYFMKIMNIYCSTTCLYGFTRAVTYDYEGTKTYIHKTTLKTENKKMLLVDVVGNIAGKTILSISQWPFMLRKDLGRLECYAKGNDFDDYTPK